MLNLQDYPSAIAVQQTRILNARRDLRLVEEAQKNFAIDIKAKVANDSTLKNETQRKAAELELMQADEDVRQNQRILNDLKEAIAREEIALELLLNEFSVLKIERREQVAMLMAQAA